MVSARLQRSRKVRTDGQSITVEGVGEDYGWVSNFAHDWGTLGDYDPGGGRPSWWVGSDDDRGPGGFYPIGPNGPGYAPDGFDWAHGGWWNKALRRDSLLPAVTRATDVIRQPVIRTSWVMETPDGPRRTPLWVRDPMLAGTAPGTVVPTSPAGIRLTGPDFWSSVLVHAIWWGRGVFVFQESASGEPLPGSLFQLNPFMVGVDGGRWVIDPHGDTPVDTDFDGRFEVRGRVFRVGVVRGLPPHDQHTPEGVLQRHWSTFRLGAAVSDYVAGTFTSGVPAGFLKVSTPQTTSADLGKLKKTWMDAHGKGRRSIAVMNANVDFQPVSITPVDADAAEVARLSRIDVAHAFGLSAAWLDTGDGSLTYANLSDRRRDLVDITLSGWGASMMSALSQFLPYGTALRVNWATFTAPDLVEQIPALSQAVSAGWMTAAEARALTGLDAPGAASETVLDESMAQGD